MSSYLLLNAPPCNCDLLCLGCTKLNPPGLSSGLITVPGMSVRILTHSKYRRIETPTLPKGKVRLERYLVRARRHQGGSLLVFAPASPQVFRSTCNLLSEGSGHHSLSPNVQFQGRFYLGPLARSLGYPLPSQGQLSPLALAPPISPVRVVH